MRTPKSLTIISLLLLLLLAVACDAPAPPTPSPKPVVPAPTPTQEPTTPPSDTPAIPDAAAVRVADPLQCARGGVPDVYVVPARQPIAALAERLFTTADDLTRVNPDLGDQVQAGALVAIPPCLLASAGTSFGALSAATGVEEEVLRQLLRFRVLSGLVLA